MPEGLTRFGQTRWAILRSVVPPILTVILFAFGTYVLILPAYESSVIRHKREQSRTLTSTVSSLLAEYQERFLAGEFSEEEAQRRAIARIRGLRYGPEMKDYFWITDTRPYMIMHPYRAELDGTDLSDYADPNGKRLFVEMARVSNESGEGFVEYLWQDRDDPQRILPKVSYVKLFEPWNWILGTGVYLDELYTEIAATRRRMVHMSLGTFGIVALLSAYIIWRGLKLEAERGRALEGLAQRTVELERANEELEAKNKELDEFTYVASHDLQEPLRKLTAFSGMLPEDAGPGLPETAVKDVEFIGAAARQMQDLVRDLLALSRAGRAPLKRRHLPLDNCVDQALEALDTLIRDKGAELTRVPLPEVDGDPTLLTQLYLNLISNAIKFHREEPPEIHLTAESNGGGWILGVKDNGVGIDPAYSKQIFEPFKRLHSRNDYEGSGIGLAICRKVVERHGGTIWVESELGEGAHFKFTLTPEEAQEEGYE